MNKEQLEVLAAAVDKGFLTVKEARKVMLHLLDLPADAEPIAETAPEQPATEEVAVDAVAEAPVA